MILQRPIRPSRTNTQKKKKKDAIFIIGNWNAKVGSQEIPGITEKFVLGVQNEAGQRLAEFCQENALVITITLFQLSKKQLYNRDNTATAKSLQSCPTLCDPRDGSLPGSPIPGILQARTLEWVAISFSNTWTITDSKY